MESYKLRQPNLNLNKKFDVRQLKAVNAKFTMKTFGLQTLKGSLYSFTGAEEAGDRKSSLFSLPVVSHFESAAGSYTKTEGGSVSYDSLIIDTVIFDVGQSKNIIQTDLIGRNGTFKEYIADSDYTVNIKGVLVSDQNVFPEDDLEEFVKVMTVPQALDVKNTEFLGYFGITSIVVKDFKVNQVEGFRNMVAFSITALSDEALELSLSE